jgi:hypothetical protein
MQKRGHKYNPSISMKLVQERGSNFEEVMMENVRSNASKKYKKCTSRAKSNSPEHYYRTLMNSREIDYSRMPQKSVYNDRRSYRSNSTFNNLLRLSKQSTKRNIHTKRNECVPSTQTFDIKNFPSTPQSRFTTANHLVQNNPFFSTPRLANTPKNGAFPLKPTHGITIINNNINNYFHKPANKPTHVKPQSSYISSPVSTPYNHLNFSHKNEHLPTFLERSKQFSMHEQQGSQQWSN